MKRLHIGGDSVITVGIPGGSRPEIVELVKSFNEEQNYDIQYYICDTEKDIISTEVDNVTYEECQSEAKMAEKIVKAAADGKVDVIVKGIIPTHVLLKEILKSEHNLKEQETLSHISMANIPGFDRELMITDCAMNIEPDMNQLIQITENLINTAHKLGNQKPKIAVLSSAENYNEKMPSSVIAKELTKHFEELESAIVYGPLSLDLAVSKESADHKGFDGPIAGDADALVVPNIDVGNVFYKSLLVFADATMGGLIIGTKIPIVLTSRSDSVQSKMYALNFALNIT